jgi:hypothetical protein
MAIMEENLQLASVDSTAKRGRPAKGKKKNK